MDDLCIPQSSGLRGSNHAEIQESKFESLWRRYESLSASNPTLSRSISMDMLTQPDLGGYHSLRPLSESKSVLRRDYTSSPRLNVTTQTKMNPVTHMSSSGREKSYSSTPVTRAIKDKTHQVCLTLTSCFILVCAAWTNMTQQR